jgi:hypothetical protein
VATLALDASLLFRVILYADQLVWPPRSSLSNGWWTFLVNLVYPSQNAPSVVAAWVVLATCGGWRTEANWLDRLGRALGIFWVASSFLVRLAGLLSLF